MPKIRILLVLAFCTMAALSACGPGKAEGTATPGYEAIQTSIAATISIAKTQTAQVAPSPKPTSTRTPTPSPTATLSGSATPTNTPGTAVVPGCHKLLYVRDVTIPDNTVVVPGQTFTKTWLVLNNGTCSWDVGFKLAFISGEVLGGSTLTLAKAVAPGTQAELSVPMVVPANKTGTLTGIWKMMNASGAYFGDPLSVVVLVGSTATPTGTGAAIATRTPTAGVTLTGPAPTATATAPGATATSPAPTATLTTIPPTPTFTEIPPTATFTEIPTEMPSPTPTAP